MVIKDVITFRTHKPNPITLHQRSGTISLVADENVHILYYTKTSFVLNIAHIINFH